MNLQSRVKYLEFLDFHVHHECIITIFFPEFSKARGFLASLSRGDELYFQAKHGQLWVQHTAHLPILVEEKD